MASDNESMELRRASRAEKAGQIDALRRFQAKGADDAPVALERLAQVALDGGNIFAELMHTVFPHPTLSEVMHEAVLDAYGRTVHF